MAVKTSPTGVKRKISAVHGRDAIVLTAIPSVKDLASSEPQLRRKAFQQIISHLKDRHASDRLSLTQCEQIWRGFSVALYMHDSKNAISVQNLISEMARTFSIINQKDEIRATESENEGHTSDSLSIPSANNKKHKLNEEDEEEFNGFDDESNKNAELTTPKGEDQGENTWLSEYARAFWQTMIREWTNIDSHRMNKYLLLVRLVVRELLTICVQIWTVPVTASDSPEAIISKSKHKIRSIASEHGGANLRKEKEDPQKGKGQNGQQQQLEKLSKIVQAPSTFLPIHVNSVRDPKISNGLKLHILDIYVDELEKVLEEQIGHENDNDNDNGNSNTDVEEEREQGQEGQEEKEKEEVQKPTKSPILVATLKIPLQDLVKSGKGGYNTGISIDRHIRNKCKDELREYEARIV